MRNKLKILLGISLVVAQIALYKYYYSLRFNVDFIYLIIFYISIRSNFLTVVIASTVFGLLTDCLSGEILGIFSFSRTLVAYLLNEIAKFIDFRKNFFIFSMIFFSLFISNLIANVFLHFVFHFSIAVNLLAAQPLFTAVVGTLITGTRKAKEAFSV